MSGAATGRTVFVCVAFGEADAALTAAVGFDAGVAAFAVLVALDLVALDLVALDGLALAGTALVTLALVALDLVALVPLDLVALVPLALVALAGLALAGLALLVATGLAVLAAAFAVDLVPVVLPDEVVCFAEVVVRFLAMVKHYGSRGSRASFLREFSFEHCAWLLL